MTAIEDWPFAAIEWALHENTVASINDDLRIPLSGRIDLVFSTENISTIKKDEPFPDSAAFWVIDFKTGSEKALSPSLLMKGEGVQIALYMLALHARGGQHISASLLRPGR